MVNSFLKQDTNPFICVDDNPLCKAENSDSICEDIKLQAITKFTI